MKKALLFGATGFIGSYLLEELLGDPTYSEVRVVARRPVPIQSPKLRLIIADLRSLASVADQLVADDVFICIGTTRAATPDLKQYYEIDHDYPILAAQLAKSNGASQVFLVSSVGANASSKFFYTRTKGEVERDLVALDYPHTHIFRPSMIMGERKENRPAEKAFLKIWGVINSALVGSLSAYKGIHAKNIAKAIHQSASAASAKLRIYDTNAINSFRLET